MFLGLENFRTSSPRRTSFSTMAFCEYFQLIKQTNETLKSKTIRLAIEICFVFSFSYFCMHVWPWYLSASKQHVKPTMVRTIVQNPKRDHWVLIQLWAFKQNKIQHAWEKMILFIKNEATLLKITEIYNNNTLRNKKRIATNIKSQKKFLFWLLIMNELFNNLFELT